MSQRPKGVVGQWYTLTTNFDGSEETADRYVGYIWQCSEVDNDDGSPLIDGVWIDSQEGYRLATPKEIERAKAEQPKPSKEAREFWERVFIHQKIDENNCTTDDMAALADEAMAEWQKRFEP